MSHSKRHGLDFTLLDEADYPGGDLLRVNQAIDGKLHYGISMGMTKGGSYWVYASENSITHGPYMSFTKDGDLSMNSSQLKGKRLRDKVEKGPTGSMGVIWRSLTTTFSVIMLLS